MDDDPQLCAAACSMIEAADAAYVGSTSLWEVTLDYQPGKLHVTTAPPAAAERQRLLELPSGLHHAVWIARLPALHRDPFGLLLLAQAIGEPLHFLNADSKLERHSSLVHVV